MKTRKVDLQIIIIFDKWTFKLITKTRDHQDHINIKVSGTGQVKKGKMSKLCLTS